MLAGGILTNRVTFGGKLPSGGEKEHRRKPSDDFILGTNTTFGAIQSSVAKLGSISSLGSVSSSVSEQFVGASRQNSQVTGLNQSKPELEQRKTDAVSDNECSSNGVGSDTNTNNSNNNGSLSKMSASSFQIPSSLANLQNPQTFEMNCGDVSSNKKRVTKASFARKDGGILDTTNKYDDPLSSLDPMWNLKASNISGS